MKNIKLIGDWFVALWFLRRNAALVQQNKKTITDLKKQCNDYKRAVVHAASMVEQKNRDLTLKNNEIIILQTKITLSGK